MSFAPITTLLLATLLSGESPDFASDVRPILAQHCFKCHGPDESRRESGLRFDLRESALKGGDSGEPGIVPGHPESSEVMRRITSTDEAEQMPPPSAKIPLSAEQVEILRRWIESGADYQPHWAFVKPKATIPPTVPETASSSNPIDRFIRAKLKSESLPPSDEADRTSLIRRVSLDLIGLPPTPEEIDEFVHDDRPEAYERLVDRLLASPHYGERWARRWLDLARYADTNGYEKDRARSMWPYRDWVIRAINDDMPFDQFTIEQIAGDLLPNATLDQRIATGFHRNTMLNEEGGIDPLEFRFYAMTDRVGATGTTWLGLTVMCAQCHTHKFDPIPHNEYYEFLACLNNANEIKLEVPQPATLARRQELDEKIAALEAALPEKFPLPPGEAPSNAPEAEQRASHLNAAFEAWADQEHKLATDWKIATPTRTESNLPRLEVQPDGSVLASGDQTKRDVYTLHFEGDFAGTTALRLEALPDDSLPKRGPGRTYYEGPEGEFFLSRITAVVEDANGSSPVDLIDGSDSYLGKVDAGESSDARFAVDDDAQTGWSAGGRIGEAQEAVWRFSKPLPTTKSLTIELVFERYYAAALGRFRFATTTDEKTVAARPYDAATEAILCKPRSSWTVDELSAARRAFLQITPELQPARDEIAELKKQRPELPTTLVFSERTADNPRSTHVHRRGEFLSTTDAVEPGVLSILNPWPEGVPHNRLGFAQWLISRENPLTARVIVNRHWATFFGLGIVRTTEDFGYQGDLPTHPELLDWLAVDFMRDWSVKRMHRQIVTSATYRQSSRATEDMLARDPENRLLARGPRVRIEAEMVRDAALAAAGLLSEKLYGPSVFPAQPASVTTEGAYGQLAWTVSPGEDRHRRGLYTFMKRTTPYAMFATFDGPSGEACLARRDVSNTPLQALTLLNDDVLTEAAQSLGVNAAAKPEPTSDAQRAAWIFKRCLGRSPSTTESQQLVDFAEARRKRFSQAHDRAVALAGTETNAVEAATWTAVARAVLNLDEFVTRE